MRYLRLPRRLEELGLAHGDGRFAKLMPGYAKSNLLILNDWGLAPFTASQRRGMLELLEVRYGHRSTLVTSQMPVDKWQVITMMTDFDGLHGPDASLLKLIPSDAGVAWRPR